MFGEDGVVVTGFEYLILLPADDDAIVGRAVARFWWS